MAESPQNPMGNEQQMLQVFQQKIGNLELTLNALIGVLIEEDIVSEDQVNEKAQEIIEEIQEQQRQLEEESEEEE